MTHPQLPLLLATALLAASPALADVESVTGAVKVVSPPPSVAIGADGSSTQISAFTEKQRFNLPADVTVDFTAPGNYISPSDLPATQPKIPAGTFIDSYYVHADQVGTAGANNLQGSITFDTQVLGVMVVSQTLINSNGMLGATGTTYYSVPQDNGYELGSPCPGADSIALSTDRKTVTFCSTTYTGEDDVRIITQASYPVGIDFLGDLLQNVINLLSPSVTVMIQGSAVVDVSTIDANSLVLGKATISSHSYADVNGDGYLDLVVKFPTKNTGLQVVNTSACVTGSFLNGNLLKGCSSLVVLP